MPEAVVLRTPTRPAGIVVACLLAFLCGYLAQNLGNHGSTRLHSDALESGQKQPLWASSTPTQRLRPSADAAAAPQPTGSSSGSAAGVAASAEPAPASPAPSASSPPPPPPPPDVLAIVYANKPSKFICHFLESAVRNDLPVAVIGWEPGAPVPTGGVVFYMAMKLVLYADFFASEALRQVYPDSTAFIIADYDEVVQWDAATILKQYKVAMARPWMDGRQMVMSTEKHCSFLCGQEPPTPAPPGAPYRYLNSGSSAGTRAGLLDLYSKMRPNELPRRDVPLEQLPNDQHVAANMWKGGYPLKLDYYLDLFLSMHVPDEGAVIDPATGHGSWRDDHLLLEGGGLNRMSSARNGAVPSFIHFNGFSKDGWLGAYDYDRILPRLDFWMRRRGDKSRPDLPANKFARLVRVYGPDLKEVPGVGPLDVCPLEPQPMVDNL